MSFSPAPSQSDAQTALRSFLLSILPAGTEVFEGQDNRVPEPASTNFVVMTTIRRERLETNTDNYSDCSFIASISATTMTVTSMLLGAIAIGNIVFGVNVAAGTLVTALGSGTGGTGTYTISPSQTVSSEKMATGVENITQPTEVTIQLDVHAATMLAASDMSQTISTLMRDDYATSAFAAINPNVTPLYADDPKQIPFINAEQQYETRYVVEACLQVNQTVVPSQQFADQVDIGIISVDEAFPA